MASVTGQDFINIMNTPDTFTVTHAEYVIDLAIDLLNIYDADLDNMAGAAGSKTVTLTSKQRGAVFVVARAVYHSFYKTIASVGVGGLTISVSDIMSNSVVMTVIQDVANRLCNDNYTRIPFIVGTDESGIS